MKSTEALDFFLRYVRNPAAIGAVCPSSRFLARKMVKPAAGALPPGGVVAELGSGTGAITRYIISGLNIDPNNLYCIEFDKTSFEVLRRKFPEVRAFNDSAENIEKILGGDLPRLCCVISCLPLLSMPRECVKNVLQNAERALPKGGIFVQFTYNLCSASAGKYLQNMEHVNTDFVMLNIPPARVDVFKKL